MQFKWNIGKWDTEKSRAHGSASIGDANFSLLKRELDTSVNDLTARIVVLRIVAKVRRIVYRRCVFVGQVFRTECKDRV